MSIERGVEPQPLRRRRIPEDAVVVVRRALERAEAGGPLFPGKEQEGRAAARTLAQRLARLKARGGEFNDIELSVYAREIASGSGRVPLAS